MLLRTSLCCILLTLLTGCQYSRVSGTWISNEKLHQIEEMVVGNKSSSKAQKSEEVVSPDKEQTTLLKQQEALGRHEPFVISGAHKVQMPEMIEAFGTPDIISDFDAISEKTIGNKSVWYYVYRKSLYRAFFPDQIAKQRVVQVVFKDNIMSSTTVIDDDYVDLVIGRGATIAEGTYENPIQKYVHNIGRFSKNKKERRR